MEFSKEILSEMESKGAAAEQITQMELALTYFTNPEFRAKLNDWVFEQTYTKS